MFKHCLKVACTSLSVLASASILAQDVAKDVPTTHWAYDAVQDLAKKGLIKGYPPDGNFIGKRALTRYEMATVIERVLDRMDDIVKNAAKPASDETKADKADLEALRSSLTTIRDLTEDFKKELLVIGADLDKVKADLIAMKMQVGDAVARADEARTLADQALENITELKNNTNAALAKKVDVGTGKLRISGLLQVWAGSAFNKTLGGNFPLNTSAVPPGRNYGGGVGDTFRLRRGELAFVGSITPKVDYRAMLDIAKIVSVSGGTFAGGVSTGASTSPSSNVLQDLWVGYQIGSRLRIEVGQQKTGLSEEGTRTSSELLTVERSIMNGLPVNIGRVGDIRDTGAMLKFANKQGNITLGLFNDNGATQNSVDTDRSKFAMFNAYFKGIPHWTFGAWGGTKVGDTKNTDINSNVARDRLGATVIYQAGPSFFEAEGAYTRDYLHSSNAKLNQGSSARGGYLLYAYSVNPKWQIVGRYDIWDPAYQAGLNQTGATPIGFGSPILRAHHNLREYTIGINHYFSGHKAKIQLNYIWEETDSNGVAFFGSRRQLLLANFQTAF